jgi:hypothetical protein
MTNVKRRTVSLTAIVTVALACSGCVSHAGNQRPISMTVRDGEFVFHWCGKATEEFGYLDISYATFAPDRRDTVAVRASGEFALDSGSEFSATQLPRGVQASTSVDFPVSDERMLIFVYTGSSESDLDGISAIFRPSRPHDLEGRWLYTSGDLRDAPCEMRGATR